MFFCQAEDGIRYLVRSRGRGDVYKRQGIFIPVRARNATACDVSRIESRDGSSQTITTSTACLLYTSDAADERSSVDLGGRRIIKKKNAADVISSTLTNIHIIETRTDHTQKAH